MGRLAKGWVRERPMAWRTISRAFADPTKRVMVAVKKEVTPMIFSVECCHGDQPVFAASTTPNGFSSSFPCMRWLWVRLAFLFCALFCFETPFKSLDPWFGKCTCIHVYKLLEFHPHFYMSMLKNCIIMLKLKLSLIIIVLVFVWGLDQ